MTALMEKPSRVNDNSALLAFYQLQNSGEMHAEEFKLNLGRRNIFPMVTVPSSASNSSSASASSSSSSSTAASPVIPVVRSHKFPIHSHSFDVSSARDPEKRMERSSSEHTLRRYRGLINNKEFSDVTFVVEDKEIYAHRNILSVNSTYFRKMFIRELQENKSQLMITIPDTSYATFMTVIEYFYTGLSYIDISTEEEAWELMQTSMKYDIEELLDYCQCTIATTVTPDNVISILERAEKVQAKQLIKICISTFKSCALAIPKDQLRKLQPDTLVDIICALSEQTPAPSRINVSVGPTHKIFSPSLLHHSASFSGQWSK